MDELACNYSANYDDGSCIYMGAWYVSQEGSDGNCGSDSDTICYRFIYGWGYNIGISRYL